MKNYENKIKGIRGVSKNEYTEYFNFRDKKAQRHLNSIKTLGLI